jgi:hypothetical protein
LFVGTAGDRQVLPQITSYIAHLTMNVYNRSMFTAAYALT